VERNFEQVAGWRCLGWGWRPVCGDFLWTAGAGAGDAVRWVLPTLRVSALVALAISILRPVLTRAKSTEEQGSVLVLF